MAPESLVPPHLFSRHSDAYMFGVLLYEIFTGAAPFAGVSAREAAALVLEGRHVAIPEHLPASHRELMQRCLASNPRLRPSMKDVVRTLDQWMVHDTTAAA